MRDGGVVRLKDGRATEVNSLHLRSPASQPGPEAKTAYADQQGRTWTVGIEKALDGQSLTLPSSGRLETIVFYSILADREGNLWLGTSGRGLYRVRKQAITVYAQPQGLVDHNVYPILEDRAGAIWIGAWQAGVSRFKDGRFTNYTYRDGLISSLATSLYEDRDGRLWLGTHDERNGGLSIPNTSGSGFGWKAWMRIGLTPGRGGRPIIRTCRRVITPSG
jgi:ligand-binding sensor domain-containing protein